MDDKGWTTDARSLDLKPGDVIEVRYCEETRTMFPCAKDGTYFVKGMGSSDTVVIDIDSDLVTVYATKLYPEVERDLIRLVRRAGDAGNGI